MKVSAKVKALSIIDNEIRDITGSISDNWVRLHESLTTKATEMYSQNIQDLIYYLHTLLEMRTTIAEEPLDD